MRWLGPQGGFELSSGRTENCYGNTIGIGPMEHPDDLYCVGEGADGAICTEDWTPEERTELANEMIRLWTEWRDAAR